jgi:hypothetical protein
VGAQIFYHEGSGENADEAFAQAAEIARYEYGHRGETGTIAEKNAYVLVTEEVMDVEPACQLAGRLLEDGDERISDDRDPAGCIKLTTGEYLFFGWACV